MKLKADHQFEVGEKFLCNGTDIVEILEIDEKMDTVGYRIEFPDPKRPDRIDARYRDRLIEALNAEKLYFMNVEVI